MPFTNQSKNSSTFSNSSKNSSVFTNQSESLNSYDLLIDNTYFLNIGDGFQLNLETEGLAVFTNQTKN